ncbi:pro-neuregulin-2, membrane-bound isoform-like isoform X2 [Uloborus diversus]|uniref:pro-neuregulin-2, membrane-bound isoform-like isoform X2 n=1 Tax=Uloborus diversus TaxID=327109 RepID=UPI00240A7F66|nr:pro-neuregulin-2, membrane-bound isoform-like isoform X2 [Uloborus diversus]
MQCSSSRHPFPRWSKPLLVLVLPLLAAASCPAPLPPSVDDPQTKALLSPVVFAGRLTELSRRGRTAHFAVDRILRAPRELPHRQVGVVEFGGRPRCQGYRAGEGELQIGERYVVFAAWHRQRKMIALAGPEPYSKRKAVAKVLCANCAKAPTVRNLKDTKVEMNSKLKLKCRISGNPPPRVTWFKNGIRVKSDGRMKVRSKRRHSQLVISQVNFQDAGTYECSASNILGNATTSATVIINATTDWVFKKSPCPKNNFCLNGGNCSYFETVQEYVCECAEGYRGQRCESKAASIFNNAPKAPHDLDATTHMLTHYWGK